MKFFIVLAVAIVSAHADVSHITKSGDAAASIVRSDYEVNPEGSYNYAYETSNGIAAQAEGVLKNANSDSAALEVKGAVKYVSADGTPVELTYVANEFGFQPQGSHLPVPPPIPAYIQRSLEYNAAHPQQAERVVNVAPAQYQIPTAKASAVVYG